MSTKKQGAGNEWERKNLCFGKIISRKIDRLCLFSKKHNKIKSCNVALQRENAWDVS